MYVEIFMDRHIYPGLATRTSGTEKHDIPIPTLGSQKLERGLRIIYVSGLPSLGVEGRPRSNFLASDCRLVLSKFEQVLLNNGLHKGWNL